MEVQFTVHCPDGHVRHTDPFDTVVEVAQFAEWGHACLAASDHTFTAFCADEVSGDDVTVGNPVTLEWAVLKAFVDGWKLEPKS